MFVESQIQKTNCVLWGISQFRFASLPDFDFKSLGATMEPIDLRLLRHLGWGERATTSPLP